MLQRVYEVAGICPSHISASPQAQLSFGRFQSAHALFRDSETGLTGRLIRPRTWRCRHCSGRRRANRLCQLQGAATGSGASTAGSQQQDVPVFAKDVLTSDMQGLNPDGKPTGQKATNTGVS
jgi:hypothetical protein